MLTIIPSSRSFMSSTVPAMTRYQPAARASFICFCHILRQGVFVPPISLSARPGLLRGGRGGHLADKLPDPPHPVSGSLGVVAELLCHPAGAATAAELPHGAADHVGHRFGVRGVRSLQPRGE
jgi:hypothetical protein